MKLSSLIVILVLFSSSLFAMEFPENKDDIKDWYLIPTTTIGDILDRGYELKAVTQDPYYNLLYHFISDGWQSFDLENNVQILKEHSIVLCLVTASYGSADFPQKFTNSYCYINP